MGMSPDHKLFEWINGLSGNAAMDDVMQFIANDYFIAVMLALMMLGLWFGGRSLDQRKRNQWGVVWASGTCCGSGRAPGLGTSGRSLRVLHQRERRRG